MKYPGLTAVGCILLMETIWLGGPAFGLKTPEGASFGSRYAGEFKASPGTKASSVLQKSFDLLPDDTIGLGYSGKHLFGGIGLGGYGGSPGFGGFSHGHGHGPFGYHNPYFGFKPHIGFGGFNRHHFHHFGYNYLFGGYPRYIFGLHNGFF